MISQPLLLDDSQTIAKYLTNNVLPVLRERHDEFLLHELVKRGENHKVSLFSCAAAFDEDGLIPLRHEVDIIIFLQFRTLFARPLAFCALKFKFTITALC